MNLPWKSNIKSKQEKYYDGTLLRSYGCRYNVVFSTRSNGKSYDFGKCIIDDYINNGYEGMILRRWDVETKSSKMRTYFKNHVYNGEGENYIKEATHGEWSDVYFYANSWYFCKYDEKGIRVQDPNPFCHLTSLDAADHDKGLQYPLVRTIIFEEFMSLNNKYLVNEFVLFLNVISTIRRRRNDVTIYMLANNTDFACPYFREMGIRHAKKMKPGTIELYKIQKDDQENTIAVEFAEPFAGMAEVNSYYIFDNPNLKMLTTGEWDILMYPHCPVKYRPKDILLSYIIEYDGVRYQGDIVYAEGVYFTHIHLKTTPIQNPDKDIIYSQEWDPRPNWRRNIRKPRDKIDKKISEFFKTDRVYYQDNEVGAEISQYLDWCKSN